MAAVSRLNPVASPFTPTALLPAGCYHSPTPPADMPAADFWASQFWYAQAQPPHPLPPAYGWPVACDGSWCPSGGFTVGVPAFPLQAAYGQPLLPPPVTVYYCTPPPQQQPSASRCCITEIFEDGGEAAGKVELRDEPSPRSVLATWSREPISPPREPLLPPPPPTSFLGKALPRPRRCTLLAFNPSENITSLMIRNIPNKFMKKRFMSIVDQHCAEENSRLAGDGVKSEYDFLYVPVDFRTKYNRGYAFVNMTTAVAARRLHAHLDGHSWEAASSRKVCDVVHARVQGLDALVAHFSGTRFPYGGDKEFLPVRFAPPRDGVRKTAEHVVGRILHRRHG